MEHPVKEIKNVVRQLTQGTPDQQHDAVYRYFVPGATFEHPFCRVPSFRDVHVPGFGDFDSRSLIVAILKWYRILSPKITLEVESSVFDQRTNILYVKIHQIFSIWFIPFHRANVGLVSVLHLVPTHPDDGSTDANATRSPLPSPQPQTQSQPTAAQEKLHAVQEGAEPSYASVASGEASAPGRSGSNSRAGSSSSISTSATAAAAARPTRYYIKKQEDLYQVNEFLKFVSMAPGAAICAALQFLATLFCLVGALLLGPVTKAVWPGVAGPGKVAFAGGSKK